MSKTEGYRRTLPPMDAVLELSRMAQFLSLEDIQTLVYDLEHSAPMSAECALARVFLAWRKQLEQLPRTSKQDRDEQR
jgi:hypothetical protein